jgi:cobalt-zinc-cadmium resistance protein CzcA
MLQAILAFCLARRAMVLFILAAFLGAGVVAFQKLNIEAYPDPAPPIVEIIAQNPGQSAEEMERYVTIPIEVAIASTPGLKFVRSTSLYGLTLVRLQFNYGTDYYFDLQQALNRLANAQLPTGVQPSISPAGGISEILRYELIGPPGSSLTELKTIQDWVLQRRFKTIPGVSDVSASGGTTKEYHVDVDLTKLAAYGVTLPQVTAAIANSNINVGGRTLDIGEQSANVRGIGIFRSLDDIRDVVLTQSNGIPVLLGDVAEVKISHAPRLGINGRDEMPDVVSCVVLMQKKERTMDVVRRVEAEIEKINSGNVLPPGVKIVTFYDRADLVKVTVSTVLHNLLYGVTLIFLIQWLFLGDLRCALIVGATIPVALFFATMILVLQGESANLLSVGAIDLGIIVDSTVIMVEHIFRKLATDEGARDWARLRAAAADEESWPAKLRTILAAAIEVHTPILFSVTITIAAFIPLFTMQGVEGQIFGPMARTYAYALLGALISTFMVAPALSSVLLPERTREVETLIVRGVRRVYTALLRAALRARAVTVGAAVLLLLITALIGSRLGNEFLPKLEEGNMWIRATLPPTISLEAGQPAVNRMRAILKSFPEVATAVSEQGRPDDGIDADGPFIVEYFVPLKPFAEWPTHRTKEELVAAIQKRLADEFVGIDLNFSQYIQDNIEEAVSGVKGENSIKLFGTDLVTLTQKADEIKNQMATVRGVEDLGVFNSLGQPNLVVGIDRSASARYGLAAGDVNTVVQAAIGGATVTNVYEGERQFALVVRLKEEFRNSIDAIRRIFVATQAAGGAASSGPTSAGVGSSAAASGVAYVPLSDLATIKMESGASYIYRENYERYLPIKFSVRERDLGSTVEEAQAKVEKDVELPPGYRIEWSGEFGSLQEAQKRLMVIVPASLALILMLLYSLFNDLRLSLLALSGIPFAVCGGILALEISGLNFSISAAVGFISLFGVTVMDGILLVSTARSLVLAGLSRLEAVERAASSRMRQIMMTALSACIGLLPAAISNGIGSQVQRPLATAIVGGMLLEPVCTLLVLPVLALWLIPKALEARGRRNPAADTHVLAE